MERVLRYNGRERPGVSRDDHMLTREDENPQNEPDSAKQLIVLELINM